jgi:hypothetical protein
MDDHETPDVSDVHTPGVTHEMSDVNARGVAWFALGLFLLIAVVCGLMWLMFRYFERSERTAEPPPASRVAPEGPRLPPEPRLQGVPGHETGPQEDLEAMRRTEEEVLATYGWVDQNQGRVRIPIERAKRLILERGLPKTADRPPQPATQPAP